MRVVDKTIIYDSEEELEYYIEMLMKTISKE